MLDGIRVVRESAFGRAPGVKTAQRSGRVRLPGHLFIFQFGQRTQARPVRISQHVHRRQVVAGNGLAVRGLGILPVLRIQVVGKHHRLRDAVAGCQYDAVAVGRIGRIASENVLPHFHRHQLFTHRPDILLRQIQLVQERNILLLADFVFHGIKTGKTVRIIGIQLHISGHIPVVRIELVDVGTQGVRHGQPLVLDQHRMVVVLLQIRFGHGNRFDDGRLNSS